MSKKLSDALRDTVVARISGGWSYQRCSDWLKRSHSVDVSRQALQQLVARHRSGLADASKASSRAEAAPKVTRWTRSLERRLRKTERILRTVEALALENPAFYAKVHAQLSSVFAKEMELLQKAAGVDQPDDPAVDGVAGLIGLALAAEERSFAEQVAHAATDATNQPPRARSASGAPEVAKRPRRARA